MKENEQEPREILATHGVRATRQREEVLRALLGHRDHPTADRIYSRVRDAFPGISLATVYNTLENFAEVGLVRKLSFQREPARYCATAGSEPHFAHFLCRHSGGVYDLELPESIIEEIRKALPAGFSCDRVEVNLEGSVSRAPGRGDSTVVPREHL